MTPKEDLMIGASVTDIGGIRFPGSNAQRISMNPSVGVAYKKSTEFLKMKFAFDLRNLDQSTSFVNKTHFGSEFSLKVLDLYAGLNQLNLTYGAAFDLWVLRISALSFAEELGVYYHQLTSQRYMLQVDFSLPI
jgi:hypothetical protein